MSMFDRIGAKLLQNSMGAQSVRQRIIAQNVANINTRDYTARRVKFEEFLYAGRKRGKMIGSTNRHLPMRTEEPKPQVVDSGEDVNLDTEMATMAKVQLFYALETNNMSQRFKMLRESISGQIK